MSDQLDRFYEISKAIVCGVHDGTIYACRRCPVKFHLAHDPRPGQVLQLLDHALGHPAPVKNGSEKRRASSTSAGAGQKGR